MNSTALQSILALDVSKTATAFAFGTPDQVPVTGLQPFTGATADDVWLKASAWINGQLAVMHPDIVAIEAKIMSTGNAGMHTNAETQEILWGLQTIFRTFVLGKTKKPALLIASSTARKTLTGRGTFPKGEAKDAVGRECMRRGWLTPETLQHDKADALAVWCHVAAEQNPDLRFGRAKAANVIPMRRAS
jgi:Holliday junction resolvasome RuvABC endonuclease subunit